MLYPFQVINSEMKRDLKTNQQFRLIRSHMKEQQNLETNEIMSKSIQTHAIFLGQCTCIWDCEHFLFSSVLKFKIITHFICVIFLYFDFFSNQASGNNLILYALNKHGSYTCFEILISGLNGLTRQSSTRGYFVKQLNQNFNYYCLL